MHGQANDTDVLKTALDWLSQGHCVALATVIETWGSAPRGRGSHMAVREDGLFVGSVSGGCVEGATIRAALEVLATNTPTCVSYGVSTEDAWSAGLACGGEISIWLCPLERSVVADLLGFISARRPVALKGEKNKPGLLVEPISTKNSALVATNEGHVSRCYPPSLRLLIVGATHVAQVLCPMARMLGYLVTVVDPRAAFAQSERWENVQLETLYPDEWIQNNPLDKRTAVVTLSHDPKIDDPGLEAALKSPAFYVGALGSRRTHAARLVRLMEKGFDNTDLARVHGPVGLDIGAETPSEIATAITAQLTRVLRTGGHK